MLAMFGRLENEADARLKTSLGQRQCLLHIRIVSGLVDSIVQERSVYPFTAHDASDLDEMCQFVVGDFSIYGRWNVGAPVLEDVDQCGTECDYWLELDLPDIDLIIHIVHMLEI
jgi:hypothetical protein